MRFWRFVAVGTVGLTTWHCGVSVQAVDACRAIEERKCEQVRGCPGSTIESEGDVAACKLFYRDQCLNGIAGRAPTDAQLDACLAAIDRAGACHDAPLASCTEAPELVEGGNTNATGCEAMLLTERLAACSFLATATSSTGAGGTGGGGAGGSGGRP